MEFKQPWNHLDEQDNFNEREVGITHPDNGSFIRIRDGGDIEIGAGDSTALILSPRSNSITIVADHIKILTRHDNGVRINSLALNEAATHFDEPAFLEVDDLNEGHDIYQGVDYYLESDDEEVDVNLVAADVRKLISERINREGV